MPILGSCVEESCNKAERGVGGQGDWHVNKFCASLPVGDICPELSLDVASSMMYLLYLHVIGKVLLPCPSSTWKKKRVRVVSCCLRTNEFFYRGLSSTCFSSLKLLVTTWNFDVLIKMV